MPRFALDNDRDASDTYRANFPKATFLEGDISSFDPNVCADLMKNDPNWTLFSGCAPCQPFSKQNRTRTAADPRRNLLAEFTRFVTECRPDFVFVENVPGMQRVDEAYDPLRNFLSSLRLAGYACQAKVFMASDFGVPQTRERLIVIASRHGEIELQRPRLSGEEKPSTVRDWIGGFPDLTAGQVDNLDGEHQAARLSEINLARIRNTPEGGNRYSWPSNLWLDCHKNHRGHSDVYGRLAWDRPASALTTRCISYSNGRFGHPEQDRAISVREAACLQTFPRDYVFKGNLASKAKQIGNAVPPLMAEAIGKILISHLAELKKATLGAIAH